MAAKKKAKGPFRWEAIIPILVIVGVGGAYFHYFFDRHLKAGLEWTGTAINGAEVNIESLTTSFLGGSFAMRNLEVTDKSEPKHNLVQISHIRFGFLWDALLRAKFVVEEAAIENIQIQSPRKRPGFVVPPSPKEGGGMLAKIEENAMAQVKSQFNDNVLGDLAFILDGVKPEEQLKKLQEALKTEARIKELETELKEKERLWKERIAHLPTNKDVDALNARVKALNFKSKNPADIAKALKEGEKIIKEADEMIKTIDRTAKDVNGEVKAFDTAVKDLEKMTSEDLRDLQNRFKIPNLDGAQFSKDLFARMIGPRLATLQKYSALAQEYMPPKKEGEEKKEELVPPPRQTGRNVDFPITKGYPLFWLKKALISSEPGSSPYSGKLRGELLDATSHPVQLKKPTKLNLAGDFPSQKIEGVTANVVIDHTTSDPEETLALKILSYPVSGADLSKSADLRFGWNGAKGALDLDSQLKGGKIKVDIQNVFKDVDYAVEAKSPVVKEMISGAVTNLPAINLKAKVTGSWANLNFDIRSNLGDELVKAFRKQIDAKVEEAKKQLKAFIDGRVKDEKAKLEKQFQAVQGQVTQNVDKAKQDLEKAKKQMEGEMKGGKANPADKGLKDLKKKLKL